MIRRGFVAEASIPVDLLNPGQVFACLGLLEAADHLLGDAEGTFDWGQGPEVRYRLRARGDDSPVARVLSFLANASAVGEVPEGSSNLRAWKSAWGALRPRARDLGYPFPDPSSPATLVCVLTDGHHDFPLHYWGDETRRDNVKFWAGSGGYPGAALARDALALMHGQWERAEAEPFAVTAPQSSSFRLDWRRDYIPIDSGFSLNRHGNIKALGYPLVELLGALGLSNARPLRPSRRNKLEYTYGVIGRAQRDEPHWFAPSLLRASLGGATLPFPTRSFRMFLGWPGKEGQARSITKVTEENTR
jgi:CRISPR-associated protein Csb3